MLFCDDSSQRQIQSECLIYAPQTTWTSVHSVQSLVTPLGEGQQQAKHLLKLMLYVTATQITDVLLCAEFVET